eukprot:Blabericola_migrator_1__4638@NODE_2458_length_2729_cov_103_363261_g1448_i1_p2_GENE_NODE_2458_length_2729_cov_103_363261_g1448_i1NODE_2458_length_2729_cov_103_363261_g1448_i1_p2_ORF_typecomplete_len210_score6_33_NODE_2458_length_2729_cov_103_363261_g1448_i16591288
MTNGTCLRCGQLMGARAGQVFLARELRVAKKRSEITWATAALIVLEGIVPLSNENASLLTIPRISQTVHSLTVPETGEIIELQYTGARILRVEEWDAIKNDLHNEFNPDAPRLLDLAEFYVPTRASLFQHQCKTFDLTHMALNHTLLTYIDRSSGELRHRIEDDASQDPNWRINHEYSNLLAELRGAILQCDSRVLREESMRKLLGGSG